MLLVFHICMYVCWHDCIDLNGAGFQSPEGDTGGYGFLGELQVGGQKVIFHGG
jgi:hypothetical protein